MRVGLDATPVLSGDTGVARYTTMVLAELGAYDDIDVKPFGAGRGPRAPFPMRRLPVPLRIVHRTWGWVGLPRAEHIVGSVDVVHTIDGVPPPTRAPLVMSVHDVLPLVIPELYQPRSIRIAEAHVEGLRKAAVVVATCHATADHVSEVTGIQRERIVVAPLGHRAPSADAPPSPLPPPYILAVGSVTPRKSFDVLAEAAAMLGSDCPPIVIAGPDGWRAEEVRERVTGIGMDGRVRFLGRVDDRTLEGLYRHAELLCHPSVAEGFGIPCLEAMTYGVPVVAGDIPSVRELGGSAVAFAARGDAEALSAMLAAVLSDQTRQKEMVEAGRARAASYTWSRTAAGVVEAYRLAAGRRGAANQA